MSWSMMLAIYGGAYSLLSCGAAFVLGGLFRAMDVASSEAEPPVVPKTADEPCDEDELAPLAYAKPL